VTLLELDNDHVVAICRVLTEHGVSYVVIGGIAARLHETGHATVDMEFALHARRTTSLVLRLRFERLAREFV
jgi:hypothetical protein